MKKTIIFIIIAISNAFLFVGFEILSQFAHFFLFGEGAPSDKYVVWVFLAFALIHMAILTVLFLKRTVITTWSLFIVTIATVILLSTYIVCLQFCNS